MSKHNVFRDGKVHVCAEMCPTCIFRPGNLMQLKSGRVKGMIEEATANDSCIPCHHQLYLAHKQDAVCRGFYERYADRVFPLRLAIALKKVKFIDPVPKEEQHEHKSG